MTESAGSHPQVVAGNRFMILWASVIGKKVVMAVTGRGP